MPTILDALNRIIFKKDIGSSSILAYRNMTPKISDIKASLLRSCLEIIFLPNKLYITSKAIIKTIYRTKISKQNLLEWQTSEEAENKNNTDLKSYYKNMYLNAIIGLVIILYVLALSVRDRQVRRLGAICVHNGNRYIVDYSTSNSMVYK